MAKANITYSAEITLKLSLEEAYVLLILCGYVSGTVTGTPREYTNQIYDTLEAVVPLKNFTQNFADKYFKTCNIQVIANTKHIFEKDIQP